MAQTATTHDFVEVHEDLSGSPLWNPDLAPTPLAARTWSTYLRRTRRADRPADNEHGGQRRLPRHDFSSLAPRRISYVTGGLITAVIGIVMLPWKLYADAAAYIFTWLIGYSSLMGAIGGILIADYWMLRKRSLSTVDLFKLDGRYSYTNGVNYRAVVALVLAILPVTPGFLRAAATPGGQVPNPTFLDTLYTYAWFVTFCLSFVLYLLLAPRGTASTR